MLWDLALLFTGLSTLYFLCVFFLRHNFRIRDRRTSGKRRELAPVISNFLFHSPEDPREEQKEYVTLKISIREYLHKKKYKIILSQILFDLQKDVAGATRERLYKLYLELGLHHDALTKLKSWRWYTVSQGILELSQMKVPDADMLIRKFINDRRGVVRKQAELAIVGSMPEGVEYLLDTTTCSLSEWQQLKLIETLGNIPNYRPPKFSSWLLSKNKDVVLFSLRLIKHYNQKGAEAAITELVKHKNDEIKIAAVQCIIDFNFCDSLALLSRVYEISREPVKIAILNAFMVLGTEEHLSFLQRIAATEKNFSAHTKALAAMNAILPESVLPSSDLLDITVTDSDIIEEIMPDAQEFLREDPQPHVQDEVTENNMEILSLEVVDPEELKGEEMIKEEEEIIQEEPPLQFAPEFEVAISQGEDIVSQEIETNQEASPFHSISKQDLEVAYAEMSEGEKQQLLEAFEDNTEDLAAKEHALVKFIAQEETNSELGYRAFSILRSQIQNNDEQTEATVVANGESKELPLSNHTVFYELYQHAADLDSRLILLREMALIGDNKELPFLYELAVDNLPKIKDLADEAITAIKKRLEEETIVQGDDKKEVVVDTTVSAEIREDHRLPLELAFLYDQVGILPAKSQEAEAIFDFDLSEAFEIRSDREMEGYGQ